MTPPKRRRRTLQQGLDGVLARQIKHVRENSRPRVTQQKLAQKLGQTQATIVRMESGDRAITVAELFQIAAALDVAPIYLLTGAFTGEPTPVTKAVKLPPDEAREWIFGDRPLAGGNDTAYRDLNVPAEIAAERRAMTRAYEDLMRRFPHGATLVVDSDDPRAQEGPRITIKRGDDDDAS